MSEREQMMDAMDGEGCPGQVRDVFWRYKHYYPVPFKADQVRCLTNQKLSRDEVAQGGLQLVLWRPSRVAGVSGPRSGVAHPAR
jgi:hypothetical protein